jgi:tRNA wybutosine-synthesizing protein 3
LTASLQQAQKVLSAALQAGFRESGALNLIASSTEPATPMVGIRTMGLSLESVIGFEMDGSEICMIPEWQLRNLIEVSNQRFVENTKRIERFRRLLQELNVEGFAKKQGENGDWEDAKSRKERKRAEGLERARVMKESNASEVSDEIPDIGFLEQNS